MSEPLHLLRPFTEWYFDGRVPIRTTPDARAWVDQIARRGFNRFETITSRMPRRADELCQPGSSVFFVKSAHTLFRMPLINIEPRYHGLVAIIMEPRLVEVEQQRVGRVRGWRYLEHRSAPPDRPDPAPTGDLPEGLRRDLEALGL